MAERTDIDQAARPYLEKVADEARDQAMRTAAQGGEIAQFGVTKDIAFVRGATWAATNHVALLLHLDELHHTVPSMHCGARAEHSVKHYSGREYEAKLVCTLQPGHEGQHRDASCCWTFHSFDGGKPQPYDAFKGLSCRCGYHGCATLALLKSVGLGQPRDVPATLENLPTADHTSKAPAPSQPAGDHIDIVFEVSEGDGPPRYTLVEVEDAERASVRLGEWIARDDGYQVLRVPRAQLGDLGKAAEPGEAGDGDGGKDDRTVWSAECQECEAVVMVVAHPHAVFDPDDELNWRARIDDGPDDGEWEESFPSCPVCEGQLSFGNSDPAPHLLRG